MRCQMYSTGIHSNTQMEQYSTVHYGSADITLAEP